MSETIAIGLLVTNVIGLIVLIIHCVIMMISLSKILKSLEKCNNKKQINKKKVRII